MTRYLFGCGVIFLGFVGLIFGLFMIAINSPELRETQAGTVWILAFWPFLIGGGMMATGLFIINRTPDLDDNRNPGPDLNKAPLGIPDEEDNLG